MRLEHFLIGLTIFGLIILVGANSLLDINNNYELNGNPEIFSDELKETTNITYNEMEDLRDKTQLGEITDDTAEGSLYKDAYPSALKIWDGQQIVGKTLGKLQQETGFFPTWLTDPFVIILGILAGTFVLYMLIRYKPQRD